MKVQAKCNFHNRFVIEIRDKNTNELKQQGVAENMILDRAYTRACGFLSYFTYICFGTGTGTLSPSRTTLFSSLGYKVAVDEEKIKASPVSKVTRKITLNPEEYVGQIITEVGISESTSAINTHALIKDAEGNPLSITKTEFDIVIIYATVFIELSNNETLYFTDISGATLSTDVNYINWQPNDNILLKYFIDNISPTTFIYTGTFKGDTQASIGMLVGKSSPAVTVDIANKKRIYFVRFGVSESNENIYELGLSDILRLKLPDATIFTGYQLSNINIGIGDGVTNDFIMPHTDINNVVIKVDGIQTTGYILSNIDYLEGNPTLPFMAFVDQTEDYSPYIFQSPFNTSISNNNMMINMLNTDVIIATFKAIKSLDGLELCGEISADSNSKYTYVYLDKSKDGLNWALAAMISTTGTSTVKLSNLISADADDLYYRIRVKGTASQTQYRKINCLYLVNPNKPTITFDTAPTVGAIITADYTVSHIPKTSDYVLDVTFELKFGEGV